MARRTVSFSQEELRRRFRDDLRDTVGADLYPEDSGALDAILVEDEKAKQYTHQLEADLRAHTNQQKAKIDVLEQKVATLEAELLVAKNRATQLEREWGKVQQDTSDLESENRRLTEEVRVMQEERQRRLLEAQERGGGPHPTSSVAEQLQTVTLLWKDAAAKVESLQAQNRSLEQELHTIRTSSVQRQRDEGSALVHSLQEEIHRLRLRLQHEHEMHQEHMWARDSCKGEHPIAPLGLTSSFTSPTTSSIAGSHHHPSMRRVPTLRSLSPYGSSRLVTGSSPSSPGRAHYYAGGGASHEGSPLYPIRSAMDLHPELRSPTSVLASSPSVLEPKRSVVWKRADLQHTSDGGVH